MMTSTKSRIMHLLSALVLGAFFLSPNALGGVDCWDLTKGLFTKLERIKTPHRGKTSAELFKTLRRVEGTTAMVRKLRPNVEPFYYRAIDQKIEELRALLRNGYNGNNSEIVAKRLDELFFNVEFGVYIFKNNQKMIRIIEGLGDKNLVASASDIDLREMVSRESFEFDDYAKEIYRRRLQSFKGKSIFEYKESLELENDRLLVLLGEKAEAYRRFRSFLEDPLGARVDLESSLKPAELVEPAAAARAKEGAKTLGEDGVEKYAEVLDSIGLRSKVFNIYNLHLNKVWKPVERLSLTEFDEFIGENLMALIRRGEDKRRAEILSYVKNFVIKYTAFPLYRKIPVLNKSRLATYSMSYVYDYEARNSHMGLINNVLSFPGDMSGRYSLMREYNSVYGNDEFLVNFARRVDYGASESWTAFKKVAQGHGDKRFAKRMEEAEKRAAMLGDISPLFKTNPLSYLLSTALTGGVGWSFYTYIKCRFVKARQEERVSEGLCKELEERVEAAQRKLKAGIQIVNPKAYWDRYLENNSKHQEEIKKLTKELEGLKAFTIRQESESR